MTPPVGGDDTAASARRARQQILEWIADHGYPIPKTARDQESYESDLPGTPVAIVRLILDDVDYWIVRLEHPEGAAPDQGSGRKTERK